MNKKFFSYYQYLSPLILTPLSFWLWWTTYGGNIELTLIAWLVPILFAYIVPGVGTNILKVWEFNTRYRLGKFRPHHGFVFGSATSTIAWLCYTPVITVSEIFQMAFIFASVLGFWNVIYDIKAIKAGILIVYNQPWADGESDEAIVMDYAPVFFAGFGMVYGLGLGMAEWLNIGGYLHRSTLLWYLPLFLAIVIMVPVVLYRYQSFKKHGHSGCKPIQKCVEED